MLSTYNNQLLSILFNKYSETNPILSTAAIDSSAVIFVIKGLPCPVPSLFLKLLTEQANSYNALSNLRCAGSLLSCGSYGVARFKRVNACPSNVGKLACLG